MQEWRQGQSRGSRQHQHVGTLSSTTTRRAEAQDGARQAGRPPARSQGEGQDGTSLDWAGAASARAQPWRSQGAWPAEGWAAHPSHVRVPQGGRAIPLFSRAAQEGAGLSPGGRWTDRRTGMGAAGSINRIVPVPRRATRTSEMRADWRSHPAQPRPREPQQRPALSLGPRTGQDWGRAGRRNVKISTFFYINRTLVPMPGQARRVGVPPAWTLHHSPPGWGYCLGWPLHGPAQAWRDGSSPRRDSAMPRK